MKKENIQTMKADRILLSEKRNYFTGKVVLHDISKVIGVKDQKVYYAGFRNGARTKIHYHEGGQVLLVTEGNGVLVLFEGSIKKQNARIKPITKLALKVGDMVHIPKYTLHWHGAIKKKNFSHVAFNSFTANSKEARTIWYDSDYVSYAVKIK